MMTHQSDLVKVLEQSSARERAFRSVKKLECSTGLGLRITINFQRAFDAWAR